MFIFYIRKTQEIVPPPGPTSFTATRTLVNEGSTVAFVYTNPSLTEGTVVPYTLSGSGTQFVASSGTLVIDETGSGSFAILTTETVSEEPTPLIVSLNSSEAEVTIVSSLVEPVIESPGEKWFASWTAGTGIVNSNVGVLNATAQIVEAPLAPPSAWFDNWTTSSIASSDLTVLNQTVQISARPRPSSYGWDNWTVSNIASSDITVLNETVQIAERDRPDSYGWDTWTTSAIATTDQTVLNPTIDTAASV
jgi:hypothetical protein